MKIISALGVIIVLGFTQISVASWVLVPQTHPTIQAGIDAANTGDSVMVGIGTYSGDGNRGLDFKGKNLFVMALEGVGSATIDCGGTAQAPQVAFNFHSGEDTTSIVRGFIIKNAYAGLNTDSGAIICRGASPQIINCTITNNHADGARVIYNAAPRFIDCTFSHNAGNGVHVCHLYSIDADLYITGSVLDHNGIAGIYVHDPNNVYIANCTVVSNGTHGIMVEGTPPKGKAADNLQQTVINTLSAYNGWWGMGSVYGFTNNVLVCSDSYGNDSGNYNGFTWHPSSAAYSIDPLFCDTATTYLLTSTSFCLAENNVCGANIGALGIGCPGTFICGDVDGSGNLTVGDIVYLINYVFKAGPPPHVIRMADVNNSGRVNIGDIVALINFAFKHQPLNCPGT